MMKHNDEVVNSPDNGPEEAPWKPEATFWNEPSSSSESDPSSSTSNSIPLEVKDPTTFHWNPSSAAEMAAQLSPSGTPNEKQQFHPAGQAMTGSLLDLESRYSFGTSDEAEQIAPTHRP